MDLGEGDSKKLQGSENRLVLSIDQAGKIVFFNKKCEKIAGYSKNEAIDKQILDLLIPDRDREQWEKIFNSTIQDQSVNSFELPWLTKDGQEVFASWTVAPVGESNAKMGDIALVGEIQSIDNDSEESVLDNVEKQSKLEEMPDISKNKKNKDIVLFRLKDKRIVFRKKPSLSKSKNVTDSKVIKDSSIADESLLESKNIKISKEKYVSKDMKKSDKEKEDKAQGKSKDTTYIFNGYNHENLVKNYETYNKTAQSYKELEDKYKKLEEENKNLKNDLKITRFQLDSTKQKLEILEKKQDNIAKKNIRLLRNSVNFIFDVVGGKKKKEEFDSMISKLEERRTALYDLETQLNEDKKNLNQSRQEFIRWREKLELLEEEIEKRNLDISKKEEKIKKNLSFFIDKETQDESGFLKEDVSPTSEVSDLEDLEYNEILDKIVHSAAIVQRGILKQVNTPFVEMLGYNADMILEKNLFDFVVSEGFYGIEKYYLKRLKGEDVASYETILLTKQDEKIAVEVSTKPIIFKGEKAEIVVLKKLGNQYNAINISSDNGDEKQENYHSYSKKEDVIDETKNAQDLSNKIDKDPVVDEVVDKDDTSVANEELAISEKADGSDNILEEPEDTTISKKEQKKPENDTTNSDK